MQASARYAVNFDAIRNFTFFVAVLAMTYTLLRPSPVDLLIVACAAISLFVNQRVGMKFILLTIVLVAWTWSFVFASLPQIGDPDVRFELLAKGFVIALALVSAYVSSTWRAADYNRFVRVYVAACVWAVTLATIGFVTKSPLLTWDERGMGLFDDPNMYGAFVVPGVICCIYVIANRLGRRIVWIPIAIYLTFGVLVSFSRAATVGMIITAFAYGAFLGRTNVKRLLPTLVIGVVGGAIVLTAAYMIALELAPDTLRRVSLANSYDAGSFGRYDRYLLSIPMILENWRGLGVLEAEKIFPEPIHNILISSFLNYGWSGGMAFVVLLLGSLIVGASNYRYSRNPIAVLLVFCFLAPIMCAFLHEGEHWRHMWLFVGLLWGFRVSNFRPLPGVVRKAPATVRAPLVVAAALPRAARA